MTRLTLPLTLALALLATTLFGGTAAATTVTECQQQIASLRAATADPAVTTFTSRQADKERAGMVTQLDAASTELSKKKPAAAIQKLADYRDHIQKLIADGKLTSTADLVGGANGAIACIQAIA